MITAPVPAHGKLCLDAAPSFLRAAFNLRRLPLLYTRRVQIALAQINPTVGDFTGNIAKIVSASQSAAVSGARLTVFSELSVCGYPAGDLLDKPSFIARCVTA